MSERSRLWARERIVSAALTPIEKAALAKLAARKRVTVSELLRMWIRERLNVT